MVLSLNICQCAHQHQELLHVLHWLQLSHAAAGLGPAAEGHSRVLEDSWRAARVLVEIRKAVVRLHFYSNTHPMRRGDTDVRRIHHPGPDALWCIMHAEMEITTSHASSMSSRAEAAVGPLRYETDPVGLAPLLTEADNDPELMNKLTERQRRTTDHWPLTTDRETAGMHRYQYRCEGSVLNWQESDNNIRITIHHQRYHNILWYTAIP